MNNELKQDKYYITIYILCYRDTKMSMYVVFYFTFVNIII